MGLSNAEQWSGTAERSETAEGRENHNHRSFKPTQSGCVFLLKNSKNRLFRLALGVTFSGLGCRQGRKRAPKGRQTIYPRAPRFNRGAIFSPSRASSTASRTSAAVCAARKSPPNRVGIFGIIHSSREAEDAARGDSPGNGQVVRPPRAPRGRRERPARRPSM